MGPPEPRRLLEEAETKLSHSERGDLARWGEVRDLKEHIKEIWKRGPGNWDKAGARSSWGRLAQSRGDGEPQKDT